MKRSLEKCLSDGISLFVIIADVALRIFKPKDVESTSSAGELDGGDFPVLHEFALQILLFHDQLEGVFGL